jgi:Chaperone of endosialidase
MDKASEAILALKPVTFRYKEEIDPERAPQFGLVAEDVERVNPDLVVRDPDGKAYSVRYDAVNAMLLNEFLKEHRKNEEQGATIARLEKRIDALTASLQKVSAQLELSKSAPQTVLNNQ